MKSAFEARQCQNCKKDFTIEPEDFVFYDKMNVPAPTWCPECRLVRRLAFDNLKTLYAGTCDSCSKSLITGFSPNVPVKKFCNTCWWGDGWDGLSYGRDVDFSRPFLEQVKELMAEVPWMARAADEPTMEKSDYCMNVGHLKSCYLVFHADFDEDCAYSDMITNSKDCFEGSRIEGCELCYECVNIEKCYKALYCVDCENSNNILFCRDCAGCSSCFGCVGLRNKQYCYYNEQLTKEEYEKRLAAFEEGSRTAVKEEKQRAYDFWNTFPARYMHGRQNENVSGDYIDYSKNTHYSFQVLQCEDCKYISVISIPTVKDCYDYYSWGHNASRVYECSAVGEGVDRCMFSYMCWPSCSEIEYSVYAINSSNCFGCVAVRKKQYCILNKQYTKEEYDALIEKIKKHMDEMPYVDSVGRVYRYGEFFPTELSAYAYNEARGQEYFPLTKDEALAQGYAWRDREERGVTATLQCESIPDSIGDAEDSIVKEIIACAHAGQCNDQCTVAFKVIVQELDFYRRMNLPLPDLCPNCRYARRIQLRNPMKLWPRRCQCAGAKSTNSVYTNTIAHSHGDTPCDATFETTYSPNRPEIVYCEECYKSEIV